MSHKGALATKGKTWATLTYFPLPRKKTSFHLVCGTASAMLQSKSMGVESGA